jgi:hypothetical protein
MASDRNVPLMLGIGIPILLVLIVFGFIFIPRFIAPAPQYDFLLITGQDESKLTYTVENGRLIEVKRGKPEAYIRASAAIYLYKTPNNGAVHLSYDEAKKLKIDSRTVAPDGYYVDTDHTVGGIFFWDEGERRLKGHGTSFELLGMPESVRYGNVNFLGWVKK